MIESKDFKEAPMWLELCYNCPECGTKRSMTVGTYAHRKENCACIVDICPSCDEVFEAKMKYKEGI